MKILSSSVKQTLNLGQKLARHLAGGEIILLSGNLGAGKTVLTKGIAQGLGIDKNEVVSPTFIILRLYPGRLLLQHFDFYRIKQPQEIMNLSYHEYLYSDGVSVIEWPQRLKFLLPKEYLKIKLALTGEHSRRLEFSARGNKYKKLLEKINESFSH